MPFTIRQPERCGVGMPAILAAAPDPAVAPRASASRRNCTPPEYRKPAQLGDIASQSTARHLNPNQFGEEAEPEDGAAEGAEGTGELGELGDLAGASAVSGETSSSRHKLPHAYAENCEGFRWSGWPRSECAVHWSARDFGPD